MRTTDKLVFNAVLPPFLISSLVLTFVAFIREFGLLSELLITRNASVATIAFIAATILPPILILSLPLSFLIGILIGMSGLSGEGQVVALRACGIPLRQLLRPVLALGFATGMLTAAITLYVLPHSRDTLHFLKDRIGLRQATSQIQPRVFAENFPGFVFYLDDLQADRQRWARIFLADNSNPRSSRIILARDGEWVTDRDAFRLQIHMRNGTIYEVDKADPTRDKLSHFATIDIPVDLNAAGDSHPTGLESKRPRKAAEKTTRGLWFGQTNEPTERREELIELHKRLSLPFLVFPFSLIGLVLGTTTKKGGRASGFVLSFIMVIAFYYLFTNGLRLASVEKISPWLGAWGADITLSALGVGLLLVCERSAWLGRALTLFGFSFRRHKTVRTVEEQISPRTENPDASIGAFAELTGRLRFPKVLDLYVSKGFCVYFLWSVLICGVLFVVLTLFDLLDDLIRNAVPLSYIIEYFLFLTPQILVVVVPMSILLAVLINFGILEKSSEITALKAGGWSLYRIAVPVFLVSFLICAGVYLLQDYVLPYANIRQDSIRNLIKGRPAQTSMRPQKKWIFGESNRIFNYEYFDASQSLFIGLNIFEINLQEQRILRRVYSARAKIGSGGSWELENGWVRDFRPETEGYREFATMTTVLPEKPSYFQKEVFEPKESSKLTYLQLKEYIIYLKKTGYNATELQVELYKKLSFPMSCAVMALVGIPFSFSMGRRGAFFGITVSIVVAISYWGIFSIFEKLGAYGLLFPLLAAWAPNLIFGAAGLALLFTIRT